MFGSTLLIQAANPSFDCSKTYTNSEKQICKTESLAALDIKLYEMYKNVSDSYSDEEKAKLVTTQKAWIEKRDYCSASVECISRKMQERISTLQIEGGLQVVPAGVIYKCDDKSTLTVYFYNDTQIPSAMINQGTSQGLKQDLAYITESGSGSKYMSDSLEFWEHHGEATLIRNKKETKCKVYKK